MEINSFVTFETLLSEAQTRKDTLTQEISALKKFLADKIDAFDKQVLLARTRRNCWSRSTSCKRKWTSGVRNGKHGTAPSLARTGPARFTRRPRTFGKRAWKSSPGNSGASGIAELPSWKRRKRLTWPSALSWGQSRARRRKFQASYLLFPRVSCHRRVCLAWSPASTWKSSPARFSLTITKSKKHFSEENNSRSDLGALGIYHHGSVKIRADHLFLAFTTSEPLRSPNLAFIFLYQIVILVSSNYCGIIQDDSLTANRPDRAGKPPFVALKILQKEKGLQGPFTILRLWSISSASWPFLKASLPLFKIFKALKNLADKKESSRSLE